MTLAIEFTVEDEAWLETAPWYRERALRIAEQTLSAAGVTPKDCEISVLLCDDARMASLNQAHLGNPKPTNVLSWPAVDTDPASAPVRPQDGFLGDIALARETVEREAREQHIDCEAHVTHLIAHGVLHLLGYDHGSDAEAAVMEGLERRALAALGVADPYASARLDE